MVVRRGNAGNNRLFGTSGADWLYGYGGNDRLYGYSGNDILYGGNGRDILYGHGGDDWLQGDADNDTLYGGDGWDNLSGGAGSDRLYGGDGSDALFGGGTSYDTLTGGSGADDFYLTRGSYNSLGYLGHAHATITDFSRGEGDDIILADLGLDNSLYSLSYGNFNQGNSTVLDTAIFFQNDSQNDLIAIVSDSLLSLNSGDIVFNNPPVT